MLSKFEKVFGNVCMVIGVLAVVVTFIIAVAHYYDLDKPQPKPSAQTVTVDEIITIEHCNLSIRTKRGDRFCFDRTDGHGKAIPFSPSDAKAVTEFINSGGKYPADWSTQLCANNLPCVDEAQ